MDCIKKRTIISIGLAFGMLILLLGCVASVSDTKLSLRKGETAGDSIILSAPQYSKTEAGESKLLKRAFYDAPPMISHSIDEMVQTKEENECLDCHNEGDEETPAIPPSHRIKAVVKSIDRSESRNGMLHVVKEHSKVEEGINNERFYCTTCHVPQATNLTGLVENDFSETQPSDAKKDVLDDLNSFKY